MRIPLARYGRREVVLYGGASVVAGVVLVLTGLWYVAFLPLLGLLFVLFFFRDPERRVPEGAGVVVAPADGKVIAIREVEHEEYLDGPALRIDIFLAVTNVHVNRMPLPGEVAYVADRDGPYLSALKIEAGDENRARTVGLIAEEGGFPFVVRPIVGAIARRIVCPVEKGDRFARGERFGMIKFGSRTQLAIPADVPFDLAVKVGDKVQGAKTVLGIVSPGSPGEPGD
jgi:phosphatidylserine decarboxylase